VRKIIGVVHCVGTQSLKAFVLNEATRTVAEIGYKWIAKEAAPLPDNWAEAVLAEAANAEATKADPFASFVAGLKK